MSGEHGPRPDDHLVEPMYEALDAKEMSRESSGASRRRGCAAAVCLSPLVGAAATLIARGLLSAI